MGGTNFVYIIIGFFIGYALKGIFSFRSAYSSTAAFVEKASIQSIKLIGASVYRIAYVEQLCKGYIATIKDKEEVKIHCNEMEDEFEAWKKETIKVFIEHYPEDYKWQLEVNDWDTAMETLTKIYKGKK